MSQSRSDTVPGNDGLGGRSAQACGPDAKARVREVVMRSGTSFLAGMRVLPRPKREAMFAIYAFCRAVDDIVDEPGTTEAKLAALEEWRAEIDRLYQGRPAEPIACALLGPLRDYDLPKAEFLTIIDGMAMDAGDRVRLQSWEDYELYCRRVAGAVGVLSVHVFGETGAAGQELAVVLGEALQTTNILRDLAEDASRGRIYLPQELLDKHGITDPDPEKLLDDPALAGACRELGQHAERLFRRARRPIAQCDRRQVRPAVLMLEAYERILRHLDARGWNRPRDRVHLSCAEKLWIMLRHGIF